MRILGCRSRMTLFALFIFTAVTQPLFPTFSQAQGVRIVDCQGNTRATKAVEAGQNSDVQVKVTDAQGNPVDNVEVKLVNSEGKVISAIAEDGVVQFPDITSDVWVLNSSKSGLYFSSISLSDIAPLGFWEATGDILASTAETVAIVGAVVGVGAIIHNQTKGGGGGGGNGNNNPPSGPGNPPQSPNPPSNTCPACNPDQGAPSIPPFE